MFEDMPRRGDGRVNAVASKPATGDYCAGSSTTLFAMFCFVLSGDSVGDYMRRRRADS